MGDTVSTAMPTAAGWYEVARQTQRWWDGHRWGEDVMRQGRRTTVTAVRQAAIRMQWAAVVIGTVAWVAFLVLSFSFGASAAFALAGLPLFGSAAIVFAAIAGSRLIAALPPTSGEATPPQQAP
ncbi:hypothetical protein [Microbacterium sp. NPDC091662]|uniref:hypothetical protein n=1 Tax=Microbacterium sp. NPDC091662 TaxID=3364211 RepID=UPI0037F80A34